MIGGGQSRNGRVFRCRPISTPPKVDCEWVAQLPVDLSFFPLITFGVYIIWFLWFRVFLSSSGNYLPRQIVASIMRRILMANACGQLEIIHEFSQKRILIACGD